MSGDMMPQRLTTGPVKRPGERGLVGAWMLSAVTWLMIAPRMIPGLRSDRGIFVSVAERLASGDRLYIDVWDNKDPIFYWMLASGRTISPLSDIVLEVMWIALVAVSTWSIARSLGVGRSMAVVVGFSVAPITVTGTFYLAGYSHLPGIALALGAFGLSLSKHYLVSGVVLGLLVFTKINLIVVALALVVAIIAFRGFWTVVRPLALGAVVGAFLIVLLLAIRGEFTAYVNALMMNIRYASGSGYVDMTWGPLVGHLRRVIEAHSLVLLVFTGGVLVWGYVRQRFARFAVSAGNERLVRVAASAALGAVILDLALTGLWRHHNQALYIPVVLCLALSSLYLTTLHRVSPVAVAAALVAGALLLGGVTPGRYLESLVNARPQVAALSRTPPEAAALLKLVGSTGSYARLGRNDDRGHAFGLKGWRLQCPRFHLYPSVSIEALSETLECLEGADTIVVSERGQAALKAASQGGGKWDNFWHEASDLLRTDFTCEMYKGIQVCQRRPVA